MRRTILACAGVLLSTVALGSDSPKEYDDATAVDELQGSWQLTEDEFNGQKVKPDPLEVVTFRGGAYVSNYSDGDTFRGSYRLDPTHQPPHLNEVPANGPYQGQTVKYIYQLDRDRLRIAFMAGKDDMRRPQGFNDEGVYVETYKRVKK
jgi:uncharacterized protein (TIGR03067 family)